MATLNNPVNLAKALYGVFGAKYPTASLIVVMIIGAIAAGALWMVAGQQFAKDGQEQVPRSPATTKAAPTQVAPSSQPTGSATSLGDCSPAITGSGNKVDVNCNPLPVPKTPQGSHDR